MDQQTYEKIRTRAFELFEARSRDGAPGDPESDWLQAEREVLEREAPGRDVPEREVPQRQLRGSTDGNRPSRPVSMPTARRSPVRQAK